MKRSECANGKCPTCGEQGYFHKDDHTLDKYYVRNLRDGDNLFTPTGRMALVCKGCGVFYLLEDEVEK